MFESSTDPAPLFCDRCGAENALVLGERTLCEACYFACNSCCGEFGGDDFTQES